ncbi:MAG: bifunctional tetrahydrofolate synthase/dihydrofolate synthase [Ketobacter sp.]|nr:bifunctional tetrahydrofolate synthase/dihydrofolate synthase [Ketobacter sp.]
MQLKDWLSRLERLHFKSIDMGLERIQAVAQRLDLISNTPFIFTVAGTNGKGSTVALIDQLLRQAGYSTGLYTSPHLIDFNERVCVNGVQSTDEQLISAFEAVEAGRGAISLTYFEFTTLAAIWLFRQQKLDAWVLEVGLGGRLDAVNIWDASVAVVTSIDIDHQAWLGNDRASIGFEKIGIARSDKPLVMGEPDPPHEVVKKALEMNTALYQQGQHFTYQVDEIDHVDTNTWSITLTCGDQTTLDHKRLPSPDIYLQNAATALQALALSPFNIERTAMESALRQVMVTGRKQFIHHQPDIMLDVGHNPHAARALVSHLASDSTRRIHCIVGMLADKDVTDTLMALLAIVDRWYPVELDCERALPAIKLFEQLTEMGACCDKPALSAHGVCNRLLHSVSNKDLILVFGSFYTVADVIQYGPKLNMTKG